jgi:hypothetical protein
MEIQYTQENVIQGITIQPTDPNFDQSIIDLMEIINDNQFYTCNKVGDRLLIGKKNSADIICVITNNIKLITIKDYDITIVADSFMLSMTNDISQFTITQFLNY